MLGSGSLFVVGRQSSGIDSLLQLHHTGGNCLEYSQGVDRRSGQSGPHVLIFVNVCLQLEQCGQA